MSALPDDWSAAGLTADEWAAVQGAREGARTVRADFSKAVAAAAAVYRFKLAQLERLRDGPNLY